MVAWSESTVTVAGGKVHVAHGGRGAPLVLLHHDIGTPDQLDFYDRLAEHFEIILPHHPGWGKSERPQWMRSVRDVAVIHQELLAELKITGHSFLGLGFGGWIAAEMATMAPRDIKKLVLVGAMGIKPPEGFIADQALLSYIAYVKTGLHDKSVFDKTWGPEPELDVLEQWDIHREMCFRIAWKPYMYSQTLPHLLKNVHTPALVVTGDDDGVVPKSAAEVYAKSLPHASLRVVKDCGHFVELEKPAELARLVTSFIAG